MFDARTAKLAASTVLACGAGGTGPIPSGLSPRAEQALPTVASRKITKPVRPGGTWRWA